GQVRFELNPATRLLKTPYPLTKIWNLATHGTEENSDISLDDGGECLAIARRDLIIGFQQMPTESFDCLKCVDAGMRLHEIVEAVEALDVSLRSVLKFHFDQGNFTGYSI
ncbi:MAG: hypothetical protein R3308_05560, partial [Thiohalobacterales bacterium]|nr:hypothetical protein [Thiohalobacterales bacterium]